MRALPLIIVAALVAAPRAQAADEPTMRVAVVRKIDIPRQRSAAGRREGASARLDRLQEANQRVDSALSSLSVETMPGPDSAACRDQACLRKLRESTGATHLLSVEASYNQSTKSYSVAVAIFETASGREVTSKANRCDDLTCTLPAMIESIASTVTEAVAEARKAATPSTAEPSSFAGAPPPAEPIRRGPSTGLPQPTPATSDAPPSRGTHRLGWWLIGGGAAVAIAGGVVLAQNGKLSDCTDPKNENTCIRMRRTGVTGGTLLGVGIISVLAGSLDLLGVFGSTSQPDARAILVGPSGVALAGRF